MIKPTLQALVYEFTIHRYPPNAPVPLAVFTSPFYWLGRTDEELSIVCASAIDLPGGTRNAGWSCLKVVKSADLERAMEALRRAGYGFRE